MVLVLDRLVLVLVLGTRVLALVLAVKSLIMSCQATLFHSNFESISLYVFQLQLEIVENQ